MPSPIQSKPIPGNLVQQPDAHVGEELEVNEQEVQVKEYDYRDVGSIHNPNKHTDAQIEAANTSMADDYVAQNSGDRFQLTGNSFANGIIKNRMEENVMKMLACAENDTKSIMQEVDQTMVNLGISQRDVRVNQYLYPDFSVNSMPWKKNDWFLIVNHKPSGHTLNQEEEVPLFLANVAIPKIMEARAAEAEGVA